MTKEEAFELFNELTKDATRTVSLDLFKGSYYVSITGPPVGGDLFADVIDTYEEAGFSTFLAGANGTDIQLLLN